MIFSFPKNVGKTIEDGRITIPVEHNSALDKSLQLPLGNSLPIKYHLHNDLALEGKLYHSENRHTCYYQFFISNQDDKKIFKTAMKGCRRISLNFDPSALILLINPN